MTGKKKILYIISTLEAKGPTNQLYGLISNLDMNKFAPHILTLSPEKANSRLQDFVNFGIPVDSLDLSRITGFLMGKRRVKQFVKRTMPDVIHTQGIRADNIVLCLSERFFHCNTIRNYAFDDYIMKFGKILGRLFAKNHIRVIKKSMNPIACSKSISERIFRQHGIEIDYIQNGIDHKVFAPISIREKGQAREKLGLDIKKRIFVVSGSLIARKDPVLPLYALRKAGVEKEAQLVVLGDGNMRDECEAAAGENVKFMGNVDNVADYLKAADVYISASKSEGLPNSVLEAMGTGLPLLLSDIDSHREILEKCKDIGDTFTIGDVDKLAQLIGDYTNIDLHEKSERSREVLCKHFSAEIMSKKYQDKYGILLN